MVEDFKACGQIMKGMEKASTQMKMDKEFNNIGKMENWLIILKIQRRQNHKKNKHKID